MSVQTSTGAILYVSASEPATHDQAGFEALVWTKVGEVTSIGEIGVTVDEVTHQPLETGITETHKGFKDYGGNTIECGRDIVDAGQLVLKSAADGPTENDEHSFKFFNQDLSSDYSTGKVFSYTKNTGAANQIVSSNINIKLNTKLINVPA